MRELTSQWKLYPDKALSGYAVEWVEQGNYILSKRNLLFHSKDLKPPFTLLGVIPSQGWKLVTARVRLAQRLLRFMVYNVIRLPNNELFITFDKDVGILAKGRFRSLNGFIRPCRVLRGACAQDRVGNIYFGEYLSNRKRGPINVYRFTQGQDHVDIVHTFDTASIRHIHGVYYDSFSDSLWCVSGDRDYECRILRTADGFKTIEIYGEGNESWRCVSMLFTEDSIYYATDAESRQNVLYRLNRKTRARIKLCILDGPVHYSLKIGDNLFFAVVAELCSSQVGKSASLWHVNKDDKCSRILLFQKDAWSVRFFMPGSIHFPQYKNTINGDELIFQTIGLSGVDGKTFRMHNSNL